MPYAAEVNDI